MRVSLQESEKDMDRQKEEGYLKTESEIKVMLPQAKESQRAGISKERFSPELLEGVALPTP